MLPEAMTISSWLSLWLEPVHMRETVHSAAAASLGAMALLVALMSPAIAETYLYSATCEKSYLIQGAQSDDSTKKAGQPIRCDFLVLSLLANGHVLVQIVDNDSHLTPTGFAAMRLDYDANPNFITMPLGKIYLPHSDPGKPEAISGIEGFCFLDGKLNVKALKAVSCAAKIELGT
jgi:hypothetical protein